VTLYALDDIDDAIDATRAFLWPFDLGRWARLALVVFFVGGVGGSFNPFGFNAGGGTGGPTPGAPGTVPTGGPGVDSNVLALVAAVVVVLLVVGLVFLLVGSIMEFVFFESLRNEAVTVRRYWGEHWRQGLRLFGFRLGLAVLSLLVVGGVLLLAFGPVVFGNGNFSAGAILLAVLVFLVLAIVGGLVYGFTTVFVVPVMLLEGGGVLAGWRRFWGTLAGQWRQYLVYVVMGFVLQTAAGLLAGIVALILGLVLLIPFGIVGLVGFGLLSVSPVAGWVVIGVVAALYLLTMLVVVLLVAVPIQTFLRYYALFVLGDTNEAFDLIPERRRAVRA